MSLRATNTELLKVGANMSQINAIFITHEHSDHIKGLPMITKKFYNIKIHINEQSARYLSSEESFVIHKPTYICTVGDMEVSSFVTPHDSHGSVGYLVKTDGHTVGVATDLGHVPDSVMEKLAECTSVILESNHDEEMLIEGPYPQSLKERILSKKGHLSNQACADCAAVIAKNGVQNIMLAHLSEENNRPSIAMITTASELARKGVSRTVLKVADRYSLTKLC